MGPVRQNPKYIDTPWLGSKGRYGSFHLWIHMWPGEPVREKTFTRSMIQQLCKEDAMDNNEWRKLINGIE